MNPYSLGFPAVGGVCDPATQAEASQKPPKKMATFITRSKSLFRKGQSGERGHQPCPVSDGPAGG